VGTRVRALIKAQATTTDSGEMNLLGITSEGEIATQQLAQRPKPRPAGSKVSSYPNGFKKGKRLRARNVPLTSRSFTTRRPAPTGSQEVLDAYKRAIRYFNRRGPESEIDLIARAVLNYSIQYQVDARLVMAVFAVESNFNPRATSGVGASGLGQLMPGTAAGLGVRNIYDIEQNVEGAIKYIREQLDRYEGKDDWTRLQLALASYNAGPGAVKKYGGKVPPYRETQAYVRKVSAWFLHFLGEKPE
jgi:soluble lytic murein transglycosylase-like protein